MNNQVKKKLKRILAAVLLIALTVGVFRQGIVDIRSVIAGFHTATVENEGNTIDTGEVTGQLQAPAGEEEVPPVLEEDFEAEEPAPSAPAQETEPEETPTVSAEPEEVTPTPAPEEPTPSQEPGETQDPEDTKDPEDPAQEEPDQKEDGAKPDEEDSAELQEAEDIATVEISGNVVGYQSITEAWNAACAATTPAKLTLLKSTSVAVLAQRTATADVTIDMANGVTLTTSGSNGIYLTAGKLTFAGGTLASSTSSSAMIMVSNVAAELNVTGGTITSTSATVGVWVSAGQVNITGGDITGKTYGFRSNGGNNVTAVLSGGDYHGGTCGIWSSNNLYPVSGLIAEDRAVKSGNSWVLDLDGQTTPKDVSVVPMPISLSAPESQTVSAGTTVELHVSATVNGDVSDVTYQWYQDGTALEGETNSTLVLEGLAEGNYSFYCEAQYQGFKANSASAEVYVISKDSPYVAYAIADGTMENYTSLADAFAAVNGKTASIYLMKDVNISSQITMSGGDITFYGGRCTVHSSTNAIRISKGVFTFASGNLEVESGAALYVYGGTLYMTGGSISCPRAYSYGVNAASGSAVISGGSIQCDSYTSYGVRVQATATISGGTFTATDSAGYSVNVVNRGKLYVSGGTFNGKGIALNVERGGSARLSGGTFTGGSKAVYSARETLDTLLAEDYAYYVPEGDDGTWINDPETRNDLEGTAVVRPIPIELISCTESVPRIISDKDTGYTEQPTLSVVARARQEGKTVEYQWYLNGEAISGATDPDYTIPLGLENNRYMYHCAISCEQYQIVTHTIEVVIAPEAYVYNPPEDMTAVYGQTLAELVIENPEGNSDGEWIWSNPTQKVGDVGVHSYEATFYPVYSYVFDPQVCMIQVTVERSTPTIAFSEEAVFDKIYDREAVKAPGTDDVVITGATDATPSFAWYQGDTPLSTRPVDAGEYILKATLPATDNADGSAAELTVSISPKKVTPTMTLALYEYTYGAKAYTPTASLWDGSDLIPAEEYTVTYTDNINVGIATVESEDKPGGNYVLEPAGNAFQIKPATLTVTSAKAEGKVYDGTPYVKITQVNMSGRIYISGVADKVSIDVTDLMGEVVTTGDHANVGSYSTIMLPELSLIGASAGNYELIQPTTVSLTAPIEITKYTIVESADSLDRINSRLDKYVSNQYPFDYQWTMTELFPELEDPMRSESPTYTWTASLNSEFYQGVSTPTPGAGTDSIRFSQDKLILPIQWADGKRPDLAEDELRNIGTLQITMSFKNYESITRTLTFHASTKVTAYIIDWEEMSEPAVYNGQPVKGYEFADGKAELGIKPVNPDDPMPSERVMIDVTYTGRNNTNYPTTTTMPVNAGDYRVTASVNKNDKNYIGIDFFDFTINKADAAYTEEPKAADVTYTGRQQVLLEPGTTNDGVIRYSSMEDGAFTTVIPRGTTAGTYTVYYKIMGDHNHFDSEVKSIQVEIKKAAATMLREPEPYTDLVYNGYETPLVVAGRTNSGDLVYSLDGERYLPDIPTASAAGEYTVYYKVLGDENHLDMPAQELQVSIGKRAVTVASVKTVPKQYDGNANISIESTSFNGKAINDVLNLECNAALVLADGQHPAVGTYTNVDLTNVVLAGQDAKNYELNTDKLDNIRISSGGEIKKAQLESRELERQIQNYMAKTYTWPLTELYPLEISNALKEYNPASYVLGDISLPEEYYASGMEIADGNLIVPIKQVDTDNDGRIGWIKVTLRFDNYEDVDYVIHVAAENKAVVPITGVKSVGSVPYTGERVVGYTGTPESKHVGDYDVAYVGTGETSYAESPAPPIDAGTYQVLIRIPADDKNYTGTLAVDFEITKATVKIKAENQRIYVKGKIPELTYVVTGLGVGERLAVEPTLQCDGNVEEKGEYPIVVGGAEVPNIRNYNAQIVYEDGVLTVSERSDDREFNLLTETITSEDGTVTTILTDNVAGTITTTVKSPDGSGSVTVTTQKDGQSITGVRVPFDVAKEAQETGTAIRLPMPPVTATDRIETAPAVTIDLSGVSSAKVEIPVKNVTSGTVALRVLPDGSIEVAKDSSITQSGVVLTVQDGETIRIVKDRKVFEDVPDHAWYASCVEFVTSRNIFYGVSKDNFEPNRIMTRGMLVTALYRLSGEPETGYSDFTDVSHEAYYAKAVAWAANNGIVEGYGDGRFGPGHAITREQLAAILWRYAGSPAAGTLSWAAPDAASVSEYAREAMCWACKTGVMRGYEDGTLRPKNTATRAEVAQMLMNYLKAVG